MTELSEYYGNPRLHMKRFLPPSYSHVLEIGCGEGSFRQNLNPVCDYTGIEPARAAAEVASRSLTRVLVGTYEQASSELEGQRFDLIICNDVIEHMPDHDWFLEDVKNHLAPEGFLVGSVPNVRFFKTLAQLILKKIWQYADSGVLDRTHLRFFTEKSWKAALTAHGYRLCELEGLVEMWEPASRSRRLAERAWIGLLGSDSRFMQFGFRAELPSKSRS